MKTLRVYISGAVQGVFFRKFLEEQANKIGVRGFVRNLEDGRVETFIEGDANDVNKMIELCRQGPKHSKVTNIEEKEEKFQDIKGFKVLLV